MAIDPTVLSRVPTGTSATPQLPKEPPRNAQIRTREYGHTLHPSLFHVSTDRFHQLCEVPA